MIWLKFSESESKGFSLPDNVIIDKYTH